MDMHNDRRIIQGTMSMPNRRYVALIILFALAGLQLILVSAQAEPVKLFISEIDTSQFPEISFNLVALDPQNRVILDVSEILLREDDETIADYTVEAVDVGTELIIVIDADESIEQRDQADGPTRREKVRDSIIRYANLFMDPTELDEVTIIVPDGDGSRILDKAGMSFPNEVINAVNFYETGEANEPDLNDLIRMALARAEDTREEKRFQAILVFTDAGNLEEQIEFESIVDSAQSGNVALYAAILGARADAEEIEQISRLTEPTGGAYVHMPDPVRTDGLYETIQQRSNEAKIHYRSSANSSGNHTLSAEAAGNRVEELFQLTVEPPTVELAVDNSRPIRRVATEADIPLENMEPTNQPLVAKVTWPDEYPRIMESAVLLVSGQEMPVRNTILGDDGLLTFDWDIRFLDGGVYELQVLVVDELGLEGLSEPLPLTIEIDRPLVVPTSLPPTSAPQEPTAQPVPESNVVPFRVAVIGGVGLILFLLLILIIAGVFLLRRSDKGEAAQPIQPESSYDPDVTYVMSPSFAGDHQMSAFLEVLENASEMESPIPLSGNNIALGRDAKQAQIAFKDRSVSRLHARIMESRGAYRIYDEGSSSGTYVNYQRIGLSPRTLQDQDEIHLGRVHLRFRQAPLPTTGVDPNAETEVYGLPG